jgi:hypothetical protein
MDEAQVSLGFVTANGIWYEDCIYSCSLAVKQQWFRQAEQIGWWPVPVRKESGVKDEILLVLQDGTEERCTKIEIPELASTKLAVYYLEFQRLVSEKKQTQKPKKP